ncbi:putative NADP(+)-dependent dehydrogenase [Thelonectria olida]|uniref:NADP(+)-dependent dehydrogenase n=1 Tax=Thelonectria olida TaxID=1576542 RepID=A0A9P8W145_9HYPO|nr:putative NADP(+)-dependent dehydrogenase [Thelonectria olida]
MNFAWKLTDPFHKAPYPAIAPSRPELIQAGKTILITGGNAGIGYAIAKAFSQASAANVIILGRSTERTRDAAAKLARDSPHTKITGLTCDVSSAEAVTNLWNTLDKDQIVVDVLVLNAVKIPSQQPLLNIGTDDIWKDFDTNVRAQLQMAERFYKQTGKGVPGPKYLVNVSTFAIHDWKIAENNPGYGLTKNAAALAMQLIAQDVPPENMQIINMNPGGVYTQNAKDAGFGEDSYPWNDADLPGQFSVWLASPEAKFLHGRFVWTEWDVDELKSGELRKKIDGDDYFLKVGVRGV